MNSRFHQQTDWIEGIQANMQTEYADPVNLSPPSDPQHHILSQVRLHQRQQEQPQYHSLYAMADSHSSRRPNGQSLPLPSPNSASPGRQFPQTPSSNALHLPPFHSVQHQVFNPVQNHMSSHTYATPHVHPGTASYNNIYAGYNTAFSVQPGQDIARSQPAHSQSPHNQSSFTNAQLSYHPAHQDVNAGQHQPVVGAGYRQFFGQNETNAVNSFPYPDFYSQYLPAVPYNGESPAVKPNKSRVTVNQAMPSSSPRREDLKRSADDSQDGQATPKRPATTFSNARSKAGTDNEFNEVKKSC